MGRLGSDSPARLRRMALATAETASSCPTTRSCRVCSRRTSFWISPSMQARDRHAGPAADHLGDVLGVDLFLQEAGARLQLGQVVGRLDDAPLEVGQLAVADGRGAGQVALALEPHGVVASRRLLLLEQADGVDEPPSPAASAPSCRRAARPGRPAPPPGGPGARPRRRRSPSPAPPSRSRAGGCAG